MKEFNYKTIFGVLLVSLIIIFSVTSLFPDKKYQEISGAQLHKLITKDEVAVIDVRYPDSWKRTGVIEQSKLITLFNEDKTVNQSSLEIVMKLAREQPVAFVCYNGKLSTVASKIVSKQLKSEQVGDGKVYHLKSGLIHWLTQYPTTPAKNAQLLAGSL